MSLQPAVAAATDEIVTARRPPVPWLVLGSLAIAALVIEVVLLRLTSLMSLPEFFPGAEGISLDFVKMLGPEWVRNTYLQVVAFLLMFGAFGSALWLVRGVKATRVTLAAIFLPPVVWAATAALMYPPYAVDLFHDLADSRLLWIYRLNPIVVAPIARPFAIGTSYGDQASAYGPLWYLLTFPAPLLQPNNYLSSIIILKLWIAVFYVASGAVIFLTLRLKLPQLAPLGATLYLWNPFVIMRDLGDAHNDVVMFFFVLLALYWAAKQEWLVVGPALMLGALVKYISLVLGPLALAYVLAMPAEERRQALPRLLLGGAVAGVLAVVIFAPFWVGARTFDTIRTQSNLSITSTPLLVQLYVTGPLLHDVSGTLSRFWSRALFLIPYAIVLLTVRPPVRRLYAASYQVMFLLIFVATAWFRPWYLLWIVTLGALLPSGWFLALTLILSFFGMFPDIIEQYRGFMPWLTADSMRLYLAPIVVVFLPPAAVWLAGVIRNRSWYFPRGGERRSI